MIFKDYMVSHHMSWMMLYYRREMVMLTFHDFNKTMDYPTYMDL